MLTPERAEELEAKRKQLLQDLADAGATIASPNVTAEMASEIIATMRRVIAEIKEIIEELDR